MLNVLVLFRIDHNKRFPVRFSFNSDVASASRYFYDGVMSGFDP